MSDVFDQDLALLARRTPPGAIDDLERRVAAAIEAGAVDGERVSTRGLVLTGLAALLLGLAGGGMVAGRSAERPPAATMLVALDDARAPSTLLLGR
ncbi:hypothetical protein RN629_16950 [Sphingomonadaceae bacterium jetA1]|jgi:hypothetical protein|uniref:hypothetical protein n=1 Tax=Facivitalis istanbulensis TaxID=3075838 RepID=UPI003496AB44